MLQCGRSTLATHCEAIPTFLHEEMADGDSPENDLEHDTLLQYPTTKASKSVGRIVISLLFMSLTLTATAVLALVVPYQQVGGIFQSYCTTEWQTERIYGRDTRYMSLEPQYDGLWEPELIGDNGVIRLPPYDEHGQSHKKYNGSIGIYG